MNFHRTLKNVEAASRDLVAINKIANSACMDYEMRADPADIGCINEGQRRIRRFRQLLATYTTVTGKLLLAKEMHFGVHHGI